MEYISLNNGYEIPQIGFGTFSQTDTLTYNSDIAYQNGYRMFDLSDNYGNEQFLQLNKDDAIIITKFSQPYRTKHLFSCFLESKDRLSCNIDIYLLHWPYPFLWKSQWREMEALYKSGKCKAIGVCNFNKDKMKKLLKWCKIKPAVNQFERHPIFQQNDIVEFCRENNIQVMCYSPVARMDKELIENDSLILLSKKYNKSVSQIVLRWEVDTGGIPIPGASTDSHIASNIDIFDFTLSKEDIQLINDIGINKRIRFDPEKRFSNYEKLCFFIIFIKNQIGTIVKAFGLKRNKEKNYMDNDGIDLNSFGGVKVLFIGGTGRLSKDCAELALSLGYDVYLLTRGSESRNMFIKSGYKMLYGDIRDYTSCKSLLNEYFFDTVIDFLSFSIEDIKTTLEILDNRYKQYIFISSATVYKKQSEDEIISETSTQTGNDTWSYAYNKYLCEQFLIQSLLSSNHSYYTIVRPYVTYGDTRIPYPIVPRNNLFEWSLLFRIFSGLSVPVFDNGDTVTTLTHTKDFAKGLVGLICNKAAYKESFHITSDDITTWGNVLDCIENSIGVKINRLYVSQKDIYDVIPEYKQVLLGDKGNKMVFDNRKIHEAVPNLKFDISLQMGINEMVKFMDGHDKFHIHDYRWHGQLDRLALMHGSNNFYKREYKNMKELILYLSGRYKAIDYLYKMRN